MYRAFNVIRMPVSPFSLFFVRYIHYEHIITFIQPNDLSMCFSNNDGTINGKSCIQFII